MTLLIYNQLGVLIKKISNVKNTNSVNLPKGFYNGILTENSQKILNFKIIVE